MQDLSAKAHRIVFICTVLFVTISCQSTATEKISPEDSDGIPGTGIRIFEPDYGVELTENTKFIFIRLYEPYYRNLFSAGRFLERCINMVEVNPVNASHSAIGFSLEDTFYGLTHYGKYQLGIEQCMDTSSSEYMSQCDPEKSFQITYALAVPAEEYEKAQKMVNSYLYSSEIHYSVEMNFAIANYSIKRKFFTADEQKKLGAIPHEKSEILEGQDNFVCSSFISYILINSTESIKNFFAEKHLDYNYIIPPDLGELPGVTKLFSSDWNEYGAAAEEFASRNPEFRPYILESHLESD